MNAIKVLPKDVGTETSELLFFIFSKIVFWYSLGINLTIVN